MQNRFAAGLIVTVVVVLISIVALRPTAAAAGPPVPSDSQPLSLITETPEEGFALALRLSRMGVTETQRNREVLHALRPGYAHDAQALIAVSHVVAVHFQTVAAANNYWRE